MNVLSEFRRDEERVLDRLVDGELSQADRRELLAALDDEPGAWRHCALAFLEAQNVRWQLSRLASEPMLAQAGGLTVTSTSGAQRIRSWTPSSWAQLLAVAACLLVAFMLGARWGTDNSSPLVAQAASSADPAFDEADSGDEPESQDSLPQSVLLTLANNQGEPEEIEVPIAETAAAEAWSDSPEAQMAARLLDDLEQAGFEVVKQQHWLPVNLSDGRQVVVPINQVDLRYPEVARFQ